MKTTYLYSILIALILISSSCYGQNEAERFTAKNALFIELGGNAGIYSLNYERIFYQKNLLKLAGRAGFSIWPRQIGQKSYLEPLVPLELSGIIGRNKNHLEIGVGYTWVYTARQYVNVQKMDWDFDRYVLSSLIPFRLGYRYQKPDGGLFFRAAYTPILDFYPQREKPYFHILYGGISIGKSF